MSSYVTNGTILCLYQYLRARTLTFPTEEVFKQYLREIFRARDAHRPIFDVVPPKVLRVFERDVRRRFGGPAVYIVFIGRSVGITPTLYVCAPSDFYPS